MSRLKTDYPVATAHQMRLLDSQGAITIYTPRNPGHEYFLDPSKAPYRTYEGSWGPEHLRWDGKGPGLVRASENRASAIKAQIIENLKGLTSCE